VEFGVTNGANVGPDPRRGDAFQQAVTEHILGLADLAGYRAALVDASDAAVTTWPQFAHTVRAAGRGLSRRGLQGTDTVGVFVQDAASHAVAVHAVRAAGAVAVPVPAAAMVADVAARLKTCRARLLITSAALAELAVQAAERSWVRQVFAFGEAAGTTWFGSLLEPARPVQHHDTDPLDLNGSSWPETGAVAQQILDQAGLEWREGDGTGLEQSIGDGHRSRLTSGDVVVATPPCGDPDAYTALLDWALAAGATIVAAPVGRVTAAVRSYRGTAAIVPRGTGVPGLPAGRIFTVG
jgi:acyl-CoA synthetase (AMP-forming)/AMP-acid ligase II